MRDMEVKVYGRPDRVCMKCRATKRWLGRHGIAFTPINIDEDPEAEAYVRSLGAQAVPVVEWVDGNESGVWWDHRLPQLARLAARLAPDDVA